MDEPNPLHPQEPGDTDLMRQIRDGNRDAFETLIRRHQRGLMNFFRRMGAHTDAEDLVQITFLKVFQYRFNYREKAKFTTFLYTLARHAWIDGLRKSKRREELMAEWGQWEDVADTASAARPGLHMDTQEALNRLPEKWRSVVVMGICQGLPYAEIASILNIPVGTVKSRMFMALQRLKESFDGH